jgi:cbb3-type cytochrome oxidase maturation protein
MEAAILLLFVSTILAGCSVLAFVWTVKQNDHDHTDRLALAPMRDDAVVRPAPGDLTK